MAQKFKFDKAKLDNLKKFIDENHYVKIGVLAKSEKRNDGFDAVKLAAVHEFGSTKRHIPERSFLRKTMANYREKFGGDTGRAKDHIMALVSSGHGDIFLNEVGAKWVGFVHNTFDAEGPGWEPLSQRRIDERSKTGRARGNTDPEKWMILQDTGAMLRSITHEVV